MNKQKCKWFAVIIEGRESEMNFFPGGGSLIDCGNAGTFKETFKANGNNYAVVGKYGSALLDEAEDHANKVDGIVLPVFGKYMFNTSDCRIEHART